LIARARANVGFVQLPLLRWPFRAGLGAPTFKNLRQTRQTRARDQSGKTAGAAVAAGLWDKPNSAALRFRSHQNALDFASDGIEKRNRRLALNNFFRMVDNYIVGDLYVPAALRRLGGPKDYDLVLASGVHRSNGKGWYDAASWDSNCGSTKPYGNQQRMFLNACEVVQSPKGVIPSFVWLELFKDRADFQGDILQAFEPIGKMDVICDDRKVGGVRLRSSPALDRDSESHLIEGCPQIVNSVKHYAGNIVGEGFSETEFMQVVSRLRILFYNVGGLLIRSADPDSGIQVCDMVICATENAFRARE
jgi:hypothetical protein